MGSGVVLRFDFFNKMVVAFAIEISILQTYVFVRMCRDYISFPRSAKAGLIFDQYRILVASLSLDPSSVCLKTPLI